ncbi:MAG: pyocin activator PrtN family protein [Pseudolabrys sp.]|nr:pyocin activator PrtN family protein [Pseudolabrys sp.]
MVTDNDMQAVPTIFYLMAQYQGRAVVPLEVVCRDYFPHLSVEKLLRKCLRGDLALPIYRSELSQKSARGVHINDLGAYIDQRRAAAVRERDQLCGSR